MQSLDLTFPAGAFPLAGDNITSENLTSPPASANAHQLFADVMTKALTPEESKQTSGGETTGQKPAANGRTQPAALSRTPGKKETADTATPSAAAKAPPKPAITSEQSGDAGTTSDAPPQSSHHEKAAAQAECLFLNLVPVILVPSTPVLPAGVSAGQQSTSAKSDSKKPVIRDVSAGAKAASNPGTSWLPDAKSVSALNAKGAAKSGDAAQQTGSSNAGKSLLTGFTASDAKTSGTAGGLADEAIKMSFNRPQQPAAESGDATQTVKTPETAAAETPAASAKTQAAPADHPSEIVPAANPANGSVPLTASAASAAVQLAAQNTPANGEVTLTDATGPSAKSSVASGNAAVGASKTAFSPVVAADSSQLRAAEQHGTAVAKLYSSMNKVEKTTKVADSTKKVLPVDGDLAAKENILPTPFTVHGDATGALGSSGKENISLDAMSGANGLATSALNEIRNRAADRTHDMVALHAIRLGETKSDSLHVVIKPGAGLQLSLDLQQRADDIDARVNLERGDFAPLNQHWPELQHRLEERGIRLAPLTGSENSTVGSDGSAFQQSHDAQKKFNRQDSDESSAFAGFALAQSILQPLTPSTVLAASGRGWETWA